MFTSPRSGYLPGLTALTELSITDAHDFGGRALEALRPLAMLRRLRLTEPSLDSAALGAVLDDEEGSGLPLLPALTYLELHNCRLLRCAATGPCLCIAAVCCYEPQSVYQLPMSSTPFRTSSWLYARRAAF